MKPRRIVLSRLSKAVEAPPPMAEQEAFPWALIAQWSPGSGAYPATFIAMLSGSCKDLDANKALACLGAAARGVCLPEGSAEPAKVYVHWDGAGDPTFHWSPALSKQSRLSPDSGRRQLVEQQ